MDIRFANIECPTCHNQEYTYETIVTTFVLDKEEIFTNYTIMCSHCQKILSDKRVLLPLKFLDTK